MTDCKYYATAECIQACSNQDCETMLRLSLHSAGLSDAAMKEIDILLAAPVVEPRLVYGWVLRTIRSAKEPHDPLEEIMRPKPPTEG